MRTGVLTEEVPRTKQTTKTTTKVKQLLAIPGHVYGFSEVLSRYTLEASHYNATMPHHIPDETLICLDETLTTHEAIRKPRTYATGMSCISSRMYPIWVFRQQDLTKPPEPKAAMGLQQHDLSKSIHIDTATTDQ